MANSMRNGMRAGIIFGIVIIFLFSDRLYSDRVPS